MAFTTPPLQYAVDFRREHDHDFNIKELHTILRVYIILPSFWGMYAALIWRRGLLGGLFGDDVVWARNRKIRRRHVPSRNSITQPNARIIDAIRQLARASRLYFRRKYHRCKQFLGCNWKRMIWGLSHDMAIAILADCTALLILRHKFPYLPLTGHKNSRPAAMANRKWLFSVVFFMTIAIWMLFPLPQSRRSRVPSNNPTSTNLRDQEALQPVAAPETPLHPQLASQDKHTYNADERRVYTMLFDYEGDDIQVKHEEA